MYFFFFGPLYDFLGSLNFGLLQLFPNKAVWCRLLSPSFAVTVTEFKAIQMHQTNVEMVAWFRLVMGGDCRFVGMTRESTDSRLCVGR